MKELREEPATETRRLSGKTEDQILQLLRKGVPLTLPDISEELGKKPKIVFRSLRKLFEQNKIDCDQKTRSYSLAKTIS